MKIQYIKKNKKTFRPKTKTFELLFPFTESTDVSIKQTEKKQEKLGVKMCTSTQKFSCDTPLKCEADEKWLLGLTCLEVYYSFFYYN